VSGSEHLHQRRRRRCRRLPAGGGDVPERAVDALVTELRFLEREVHVGWDQVRGERVLEHVWVLAGSRRCGASNRRRPRTSRRTSVPAAQRHVVRRVAPMAAWTARDVWRYAKAKGVPMMPLHELARRASAARRARRCLLGVDGDQLCDLRLERPSASHPVGGAGGPPVGLRTLSRRAHGKGSFNRTQAVYTSYRR